MLSDENKADYVDCILGKVHACIVILSKMAEVGSSGRRIVQ